MSTKNRKATFIQSPRAARRLHRVTTGLILGTSLLVGTAIVRSSSEPASAEAAPAERASIEPVSPEWAQRFDESAEASEAVEIIEAAPAEVHEPVEAAAPALELAVAHEDDKTDFADLAQRQIDKGDLKDALTSMRKHIHAREVTVEELFLIGHLGLETRTLDVAEVALKEAIQLAPDRSEFHTELARVYLRSKRTGPARKAADEALEIDRDNPAAWNLLGRIAMKESHWQRAEMAMSHALELDPTNPMYHNNAGLLYIYMKRGDDAVDALETAVELYEEDAPHFVFNNLGLAHELASNFEEAREAFEEALLLNPFYSRAKVNLQRVETTMAKLEEKKAFQTAQGVELQTVGASDDT